MSEACLALLFNTNIFLFSLLLIEVANRHSERVCGCLWTFAVLQIPWILCYSFVAGTVDQSFSRCYGMCHHFEVYLLAESYILHVNHLL